LPEWAQCFEIEADRASPTNVMIKPGRRETTAFGTLRDNSYSAEGHVIGRLHAAVSDRLGSLWSSKDRRLIAGLGCSLVQFAAANQFIQPGSRA
jgi:hypothetical protein